MTYKLVLIFALLAFANATADTSATTTDSPVSSAFTVAPGNVWLNSTLPATNLTGGVVYTGGFDNTTNYAFIFNRSISAYGSDYSSVVYTIYRRQINASYPASSNTTDDTTITTSIKSAETSSSLNTGKIMTAGGPGYLGIANVVTVSTFQTIAINYLWANSTTPVSLTLATATATTTTYTIIAFWYDFGAFFCIYETYDGSTGNTKTTGHYLQGLSVTGTTAYYNSTVTVDSLTLATGKVSGAVAGQNYTNSTTWSYLYKQATAGTVNYVAITAATGVAASPVTVTTDTTTTTTVTVSTTATTIVTTNVYNIAGVFGSYSTYGYLLGLTSTAISTPTGGTASTAYTYSNVLYINGTASTTLNITNPTGYNMPACSGLTTSSGFDLFCTYASTTSGAASIVYMNSYYANGTAIATLTSLGTYSNMPQLFHDYVGSPWLGYTTQQTISLDTTPDDIIYVVGGYAGEIAYNNLSAASVLSSIFATLTLMVVALFAF